MAAMVLMCPRLGAAAYGLAPAPAGPRDSDYAVVHGVVVFCPNAKAAAEQTVVAKKSVVHGCPAPDRSSKDGQMTGFSRRFFLGVFHKAPWKGVVPNPEENSTMNPMNPIRLATDPTWEFRIVLSLEEAEKIRFFLSGIYLRSLRSLRSQYFNPWDHGSQ